MTLDIEKREKLIKIIRDLCMIYIGVMYMMYGIVMALGALIIFHVMYNIIMKKYKRT